VKNLATDTQSRQARGAGQRGGGSRPAGTPRGAAGGKRKASTTRKTAAVFFSVQILFQLNSQLHAIKKPQTQIPLISTKFKKTHVRSDCRTGGCAVRPTLCVSQCGSNAEHTATARQLSGGTSAHTELHRKASTTANSQFITV